MDYSRLSSILGQQMTEPKGKDLAAFEFEGEHFEAPFHMGSEIINSPIELITRLLKGYGETRTVTLTFTNCSFNSLMIRSGYLHFSARFIKCTIQKLKVEGLNAALDEISLESSNVISTLVFGIMNGRIEAIQTKFESIRNQTAVFNSTTLFENCSFGYNQTKGKIDFSDIEFKKAVSFKGSEFHIAPMFFNTSLHEDTEFGDCKFYDVHSEFAWRAYRTLKQFMMQKESDHEAQMFHALELDSRYQTELPKGRKVFTDPKGAEAISSLFLKHLNDYGRHLWLPLLWLTFTANLFLIFYAMFGGLGCVGEVQGWVKSVCTKNLPLYYAARNLWGPFGLVLVSDAIVPNTLGVKVLGFIQLIISSIIWFVWILQIRSRFKI